MSTRIDFAIVGCGHIAARHAAAINAIPGANLAACADKDPARAAAFARRFGGEAYDGYDALLAQPRLQVVCICTPSGLHVPQGLAAAAAGKHIVMEKPLALNVDGAASLIDACSRAGLWLTVVHPHRFLPAVIRLRQAVREGWFGRISHASAVLRWNRNQQYYDDVDWRGTRDQDGGVLYNQAYHLLDLLLWLMGPVKRIRAFTATRGHAIEVPDVAVGAVEFQGGPLGTVEVSTNVYPENMEESLYIFGERGSAGVGGRKMSRLTRWEFDRLSPSAARAQMEQINGQQEISGHQAILQSMVRALRDGGPPAVDPADGYRVLELIDGFMTEPARPSRRGRERVNL